MKKKLLAIMLCAVLLTGVCATSFAVDSKSVMRLALSKHAKKIKENECDFSEIKQLLRSAYFEFNKLSKPTFEIIKNDPDYKALPRELAAFEKYNDDEDILNWYDDFDEIIDMINTVSAHAYDFAENNDLPNDKAVCSGVDDITKRADDIMYELLEKSR